MDQAEYIRQFQAKRDPVLDDILKEALLNKRLHPMQLDDNAARFLQILTMLHRPKLVVEIGTFFGYSAIHMGRGLPIGGKLITIEIDAALAHVARVNIERAQLSSKVEVIVEDAGLYLASLAPNSVDMIFIDADKSHYPEYLKSSFKALRSGGLLVADDAFAHGNFAHESSDGSAGVTEVKAINSYNRAVCASPLMLSAFVGTQNGMIISLKHA